MPVFSIPPFGIDWILSIIAIIVISVIIEVIRNRNLEIDNITEAIENRIVLQVSLSRYSEKEADTFEQFLIALHGIVGNRQRSFHHLSFECVATSRGIEFYIVCDPKYKAFIEGQVYANYPTADILEVTDYTQSLSIQDTQLHTHVTEIELEKDYLFPIKTYDKGTGDSISSLFAAIGKMQQHEMISYQLLVRPVNNKWQKRGVDYITNVRKGINPKGRYHTLKRTFSVLSRIYDGIFSIRRLREKPFVNLTETNRSEITAVQEKLENLGYEFKLRILSVSPHEETSQANMHNLLRALHQFDSFTGNNLKIRRVGKENLDQEITNFKLRFMEIETSDVLFTKEIASLYHFPSIKTQSDHVVWLRSKKSPVPASIPTENCTFLGDANYRGTQMKVGIKKDDRRRHTYLIGKSGSGKSNLLKTMIIQDIIEGNGVGVIDPHGELIDDILHFIPESRKEDVIYIDPSDTAFPISLNVFEYSVKSQKDYIASSILDIFKKHFDSWGPRLEYILHNAILTLLFDEDATMLGIQRILTDQSFRRTVLQKVDDPVLLRFWNEEYAYLERNSRLITETISPIQNKVGMFLSSQIIRNMVGQKHETFNFNEVLNGKKILLCNLSEGKIGESASSLLGSLLITKLQIAAMSRVSILESKREDFYLYIDEFQNFSTNSFIKILSEARKYRLNLIIAHQYLAQLSEDLKKAVFGNIGNIICFTLGSIDAELLEKEFLPIFHKDDLISLDKYQIYVKEVVDGKQALPFSAQTELPNAIRHNVKQAIIDYTRKTYALPKETVDQEIREWSMRSFNVYDKYKSKQASYDIAAGKIPLAIEEIPDSMTLSPQQTLRLNH